jgi:hypothetical protein
MSSPSHSMTLIATATVVSSLKVQLLQAKLDLNLYRPYRSRFHALQEEFGKEKERGESGRRKERKLRTELEMRGWEAKWQQEADWRVNERELKMALAVERKKVIISDLEVRKKAAEFEELTVRQLPSKHASLFLTDERILRETPGEKRKTGRIR